MNKTYPFDELKGKLDSAQKILILLPKNPLLDYVAAALSLSLTLEQSGKTTSVICDSPMTVEFNRLVGVTKVTSKIQGTDLIISLNYSPDQVEKVSYNDDNNHPNVVIQPKPGAPALSENLVSFSFAGAGNADVVIAVGVKNQNQLNISDLDFSNSYIVDLDTDPGNPQFGHLNIIDSEASSVSELAMGLVLGLNLPFDVDIAQNLISGIWRNTQGLTSTRVGADTYEAVALCLRTGAQKPTDAGSKKDDFFTSKKNQPKPQEKKVSAPEEKLDEEKVEEKPQEPQKQPPADWFEPKIFKGNSLA